MFRSIPGLYPLSARSTPTPHGRVMTDNQKCFQIIQNALRGKGAASSLVENHWLKHMEGVVGVRRCPELSYEVWENMDEENEEKVALVISYQNFKYSNEFWRRVQRHKSVCLAPRILLEQWFSECGSHSSRGLIKNANLKPLKVLTQDLLNQRLWGWAQHSVLASPPGDADYPWSLRTTDLQPEVLIMGLTVRMCEPLPFPHITKNCSNVLPLQEVTCTSLR